MTTQRNPDEIMADFDAAVAGTADIDPRDVLWEILDDVRNSYRLAMKIECLDAERADEVQNTVLDYLVNHYGDD